MSRRVYDNLYEAEVSGEEFPLLRLICGKKCKDGHACRRNWVVTYSVYGNGAIEHPKFGHADLRNQELRCHAHASTIEDGVMEASSE